MLSQKLKKKERKGEGRRLGGKHGRKKYHYALRILSTKHIESVKNLNYS